LGRTWFAGPQAGFFFDVEGKSLYRQIRGSSVRENIFSLAGTIMSVASSTDTGLYAFVDEYFSIGMTKIDETGNIMGSWIGGPVFAEGLGVVAGEMLDDGTLLLAAENGSLVKADVNESIRTQSWKYTVLNLIFDHPFWLGNIEGRSDRALIFDNKGLHLVNLANETIIQTMPTPQKDLVYTSKRGDDHIAFYDAATDKVNFITAVTGESFTVTTPKIPLQDLNGTVSGGIRQSFCKDGHMVFATTNRKVIKVALADSRVVQSIALPKEALLGLSLDFIAAMYDSPLGYVELIRLSDEHTEIVKGFNRATLQR
jgi:hypothetical protein